MFKVLLFTLIGVFLLCGCNTGPGRGNKTVPAMEAWPSPIEMRTYPGAFSRDPQAREIGLSGLIGEYVSAQVVVKCGRDLKGLSATLSDLADPHGMTIPAGAGRVRYGAYLPVDETMTLTADPLLEQAQIDVPANVAQPVWLTLAVPRDAKPGNYEGTLAVRTAEGDSAVFSLRLEVLPLTLPEPWDWKYYLNIWQDPSGVARAYKVKVWSEEHWRLLELYAQDFARHGMKSVMASVVYDPWRSQSGYPFDTMVEWSFPGEFQTGQAGRFTWDFTAFDRYIGLMMKAGVREKIDLYALVMGPGSTTQADIRYLDSQSGEYRTLKLKVGEPAWREAWTAFLPVLETHLKEKGWFGKAVLGFDEKTPEVMKVIFEFLLKTAPDFRVALSGGFPGDARKRGDEIVFHIDDMVDAARWAKIEPLVKEMHADSMRFVSFYTACSPYYPNTFLYSSLRESRLMAWLAWKFGFDGYTRWAVNAYPEDVWTQPNFNWHSGDMYFVYPGKEGPLDGMRWELMRQGIQDYETLRLVRGMAEKAGRKEQLDALDSAVETGTLLDACSPLPTIQSAREVVNQVLRNLQPGS
jgi:hypothetical protein